MKNTLLFFNSLILFLFVSSVLFSQTVDITFRVDMQNEASVSPDGVHIAGNFPDPYPLWNPGGIQLTEPQLGSVYEVTLSLPVGYYLEFKYVNGNDWPFSENVPNGCASNGNRYLTVPDQNDVLDIVCFGKCILCNPPQVDITFQVDMTNETVSPDGVYIIGTFNSWNSTATPLTNSVDDIYEVTLTLGAGEWHEFKYVNGIDGQGGFQESVPPSCAAGFNRFLTVPSSSQALPLVCFGSCDPCVTVVDVNVTFRVDMSEQTVAGDGVYIAGNFTGWSQTPITDMGNGIWEYTTILQSDDYHEYKFLNGADGWEENIPWYCSNNGNRFINVPENDTTYEYCFAECLVCNPPQTNVTFQVDMSLVPVSENGVHLMGSFQGWDPAALEMTDTNDDNIYEVTVSLDEGDFVEYKFVNGNDYSGAELVPGECSGFGGNREFFVPEDDFPTDLVCFGACEPCVIPTNVFDLKVYLEGPFNGTSMEFEFGKAGLFPVNQPYNVAPWNYPGLEVYTGAPSVKAVDWVLLEFRYSTTDAAGAVPDNQLNMQAAILLNDGSIVQPDGVSLPEFTGGTLADLYVIVWHRNHLGVMSASNLVETDGNYVYDFTDAIEKAYLDGQSTLGGGMYGMTSGDSDGDGIVDDLDKVDEWNSDAGKQDYLGSDLNLDTQVNNIDKDEYWLPNNSATTKVPQ